MSYWDITIFSIFTMRCTIVQSAVLWSHAICLSVCDIDGSWPHRLKILETNCANNYPNIFALRSPEVIHLFPGEHGEILGRLEVGLALVCSFGMASATPLCLSLDCTFIAGSYRYCISNSVLHNKSASCSHVCDSTAFLSRWQSSLNV